MQRARREIALYLCLCLFAPGVGALPAGEKADEKEKGKGKRVNPDGFEPYLDLKSAKYLDPENEGAPGAIRFGFDISEDVPKGAKITFTLVQYDLPVIRMNYTLKKDKREGIAIKWPLKEKLAAGQYFLRAYIEPKKQSRSVQRALKKKAKRFPARMAPWRLLYLEDPIVVGGSGGSPCEPYTELMDKLVDNLDEFLQKMDRAKAAKEFVSGESLDVAQFTAYVIEWRKKQGEIQKEIKLFPENNRALFEQAKLEYDRLVNLSGMVSKYSIVVQKEVTDQYKVEEIKPKSHKWFVKVRALVDYDSLARTYDLIRKGLNCPEDEGEGEEDDDGEDGEAVEEKPKSAEKEKTEKKEKAEKKSGKKKTGKKAKKEG